MMEVAAAPTCAPVNDAAEPSVSAIAHGPLFVKVHRSNVGAPRLSATTPPSGLSAMLQGLDSSSSYACPGGGNARVLAELPPIF